MIIDYNQDPGVDAAVETVVIHVGEINDRSARAFAHQVAHAHATGQPFIPIVINSGGGEIYSLMSMIDTMGSSEKPFITIVDGKAMSCGAVLFSFGEERFIGPNATIMIHDAMILGGDAEKSHEVQATASEIKRLNERIWEMMEKNIKKKKGFLWKKSHEGGRADLFVDANKAIEWGLATKIGIPRWSIHVGVQHVLRFPE